MSTLPLRLIRPCLLVSLLVACATPPPRDTGGDRAPDTADPSDTSGVDSSPTDTADTGEPPVDADGDGVTEVGGDCDDGDAAVFPGATERCDGVDEDCDGVVDGGLRVPEDQPSLQAAILAAADGATICIAAGTHAAGVAMNDRSLTIEGAGSALTVLDASGIPTAMKVDGGVVTLRGLTITGGAAERGAGLAVFDAAVTLEDVAVRDNVCVATSCEGTGIYGARARLTATGLQVTGNTQTASTCTGAGIYLSEPDGAELADVEVTENRQTGAVLRGSGAAFVGEGDVALEQVRFDENEQSAEGDGSAYGSPSGAGLYVERTTLTGETVSTSQNRATMGALSDSADGIGLSVFGADVTVVGLTADDNLVEAREALWVSGGGARVWEGALRVDGGTFSRNGVATTAYASVSGTGLSAFYSTLELDHVEIDENDVSTSQYTPEYLLTGGGLDAVSVVLTAAHLAVRGNSGDADQPLVGGGISLNQGSGVFTNLIVSGNGVDEADTEDAVAMAITEASVTLTNADIVGNGRDGWCCSAPVWLTRGADVTFVNVAVIANIGHDAGAFAVDESTLALRYGDLYGNSAPTFTSMDDPTGTDGNLAVDPGYTDLTGGPVDWDLHLAAGSALFDAGDPGLLDADGTRSDIGAFGGPGGADW